MCAETTTATTNASTALSATAANTRTGRTWMTAVGCHVATVMDTVLDAMERWRQRRALQTLDDHLLRDIGISRADVEREAGKSIWSD